MNILQILQKLIAAKQQLLAYFKTVPMQPTELDSEVEPIHSSLTSRQVKIKGVLLKYMDKRCTLNPQVPPDVGCMEAVSFLWKELGIDTGSQGIAGTAAGLDFVLAHPAIFEEIFAPEPYAYIDSATGTGNGSVEGHTGHFGELGAMYPNDWGIVSNDSQTGLLREQWSWETLPNSWTQWYTQKGGIKPRIFRIIGT